MTSAWHHRWGQIRNDDVSACEWSTWTDDLADNSGQWRVERWCGADAAMMWRWHGDFTKGGKPWVVSGNIEPSMVQGWFWKEAAWHNEMAMRVRSPTSSFWRFRALMSQHREWSEIIGSRRMEGPKSNGWRAADFIGWYSRARGINKCFYGKARPGRTLVNQRIMGFAMFYAQNGFLGILINKTRLGLLNQADLNLIPIHCFSAIFPFALRFICALSFGTIRLYCLGEGVYTYFWGFFFLKVIY